MNQEGLLFPKEVTKKKREKHGKCIMPGDQHGHNYCDQCGQRLDWSGWDKQYREWSR